MKRWMCTEVTCPNQKSYCWVDIYGGHKQLNSGLIGDWDRLIQQGKGTIEVPDAAIVAKMRPTTSSRRAAITVVEPSPQTITTAERLQPNTIETIVRQAVSAALRERSHSPRRRSYSPRRRRRRSPSPRYRSPSPSPSRRIRRWNDRIYERSIPV